MKQQQSDASNGDALPVMVSSSPACRQAGTMHVDPAWRIGIVYATYYKEETDRMVENALTVLRHFGIYDDRISLHPVSGAFEVPLLGAALCKQGRVDALIGLGIVVEGETHHARLVAENAARGMMDVQTKYALPFVFEVLYVDDIALARERLMKGADAARCALHSLALLAKLQS